MKASIVFLCLSLVFRVSFAQSNDSLKNTFSISYDYAHFNKQFTDDWHIAALEYKRQTKAGAVLGRINYADRLQQQGLQVEAEAYPVISKKVYAYVGAGYSNKMPVFPKWRTGASVFVSLPKAWETEVGFRHLYFTKNIWIGSAGLSKYAGSWLLNARSFFSLNKLGIDQSFFITARKYLKNEKDYLWLQLGTGISPDESRNIQLGESSATLSSRKIIGGAKVSVSKRNQVIVSAGITQDEYLPKTFGNQFIGSIGLTQKF